MSAISLFYKLSGSLRVIFNHWLRECRAGLDLTEQLPLFLSVSCCIRREQGTQRKRSVNTLRSPLSAEFRRHCVLSGGTPRRTLPLYQSEEIKILNSSFSRMRIEPTICRVYVTCCGSVTPLSPCATTDLNMHSILILIFS